MGSAAIGSDSDISASGAARTSRVGHRGRVVLCVAAALVILLAAASCQRSESDGAAPTADSTPEIDPGTASPGSVARGSTTWSVTSTTMLATTSTTLLPTTTTTTLVPEDLPACRPDMASTLLTDEVYAGAGSAMPDPPLNWEWSEHVSFDWNLDGVDDTLTVGEPAGTVVLRWDGGSITVTGVRTNFQEFVTDAAGRQHGLYTSDVDPAAVGDVTGDGRPDLMVLSRGTLAVLAGDGAASVGRAFTFEELGRSTPGWRNEPFDIFEVVDRPRNVEGPFLAPTPNSSATVVWDVNRDGVSDILVSGVYERSSGPQVFYGGTPCSTVG